MSLISPTLTLVVAGSFGLLALGCGSAHPDIVPVSGKVTIDGEPIKLGQIAIYPEGHRQSIGKIEPDGSFTLRCFEDGDGVLKGTHVACVTAVEAIDENSNRWYAPIEYASRATSDLRVTIDGPTDDLKLDLTWKNSKQSGPFVQR